MITGEFIKSFVYKEDFLQEKIYDYHVSDLECKHVAIVSDNPVYLRSVSAGYNNVVLGSHRSSALKKENDIIVDMSKDCCFMRPIRIVYAKDNRLWCDNTHSAIAYIRRYGNDISLSKIPFYLIDIRYELPIIISINNSVLPNLSDMKTL